MVTLNKREASLLTDESSFCALFLQTNISEKQIARSQTRSFLVLRVYKHFVRDELISVAFLLVANSGRPAVNDSQWRSSTNRGYS